MVSTKITSSDVAEIDRKLNSFIGDMVKIEYLENCLKIMIPNDAARFCHIKLSELYANRLMFGPAARQMEMAGETAVIAREKIEFYLKAVYYFIKISDYIAIDKDYKKALMFAKDKADKEAVSNSLKLALMNQAEEYEKKNKRSNAAQIYQRLFEMPITGETEKKHLIEKLGQLNSSLGRLKEAVKYEMMAKKPIEMKRNPEDEFKKVSFEDLGLDEV